jgi:hypothetical protein
MDGRLYRGHGVDINAILSRGRKDVFFIFYATWGVGLQTGVMRIKSGVTRPLKFSGANAILRLAIQTYWRHIIRPGQRSLTRYSRSSIHTSNARVLTMLIVFLKLEDRMPVVRRILDKKI